MMYGIIDPNSITQIVTSSPATFQHQISLVIIDQFS